MADRVKLLGIELDALSGHDALRTLNGMLSSGKQHHVTTPNSEMLVETCRNNQFKNVLQQSSLKLPDSVGLLIMARLTGQKIPARVTGIDTVAKLCKNLKGDHPVFFLGGRGGVAEKAAFNLQQENHELVIAGTYEGKPKDDPSPIIEKINQSGAHVLFVAYGAPKQDMWIAENLKSLPHVRIAMGVGGTFDFLAGRRKRAPYLLQKIGAEWLWRLMQEPWRIIRIWNAVVVFPYFVIRYGKNG